MRAKYALFVLLLVTMMTAVPLARAVGEIRPRNPDPVEVSWYVEDELGDPVDGAWLTIYYCPNTTGPFVPVPEDDPATNTYIIDRIADARRNPVITGYYNPDKSAGYAVADVHVVPPSAYFFYVEINIDGDISYWPTADSSKPDDPLWMPVSAAGSPSDYAASGNGIGTGPTTAYPTSQPPPNYIPEVPLGVSMAAAAMMIGIVGYVSARGRKQKGELAA